MYLIEVLVVIVRRLLTMSLAMAALGAALLGWVAGMWTFKRAQRWCPSCGDTLDCLNCRDARHRASKPATDANGGALA